MKRLRIISQGIAFVCLIMSFTSARANFALERGDRVVFYGDSITEQRFYTLWVEAFVTTRLPGLDVRFWNAGIGGDQVEGGMGGPVALRMERDVFAHRPNVVTVMLGMNDGEYTRLTRSIEESFQTGYASLFGSLKRGLPNASLVAIGPSAFDEVTRPARVPAGPYNPTLIRFGAIAKSVAHANGALFVDANHPFVAGLTEARRRNLLAAQFLIPDRVHPNLQGSLLIAGALLEAWDAPKLVSHTRVDATSVSAAGSEGVQVSRLRATPTSVSWSSLEQALPMPFAPSDIQIAFVRSLGGFWGQANRQLLSVSGLRPGRYRVLVDGEEIGAFTSQQLRRGVDLALLSTPMLQQAQTVFWRLQEKADLQFVNTRLLIRGFAPAPHGALEQAEEKAVQDIRAISKPLKHEFQVTRS